MIGDRCARCTGLALQAFFSAQLPPASGPDYRRHSSGLSRNAVCGRGGGTRSVP